MLLSSKEVKLVQDNKNGKLIRLWSTITGQDITYTIYSISNYERHLIHSKRKRSQNNLILGCIIHNLVRIKMTTLNNFESTAEGAYLEHVVCWRFRRKLLVGLVRAVYIPARHREHPCALLSCPRAEQKTALGWEVGAIEKQTMYSSCSATIAERS